MIPKNLKIGGMNYKVILDKTLFTRTKRRTGQIDYNEAVITIQENTKDFTISLQKQEEILVHELIHGLFRQIGEHKMADDEKLVENVSNLLYQILKDNKLRF